MGFQKSVECNRCELTTTYTNEVEYNLWQSRPGCPACFKQRKGEDDESGEHPDAEPMSIAGVMEWYQQEMQALTDLRRHHVITATEYDRMMAEVIDGARLAIGLEPIGDELP